MHNEPLSLHTSLKVGGAADLYAIPDDEDDLQDLLRQIDEQRIPWFIIGGGYNLLVRDGGFRGLVISLKKFNRIGLRGADGLHAGAGATNQDLARFALENGLTGLEFLIGIPGTVGGAVRMNAGAHGSEIFNGLSCVTLLDNGEIKKYKKMSLNYGYRSLQIGPDEIILTAEFQLAAGSREQISATMAAFLKMRRGTQKVSLPNAGSFFRNPAGLAAWQLIDKAGLRGFSVGAAQVSEKHTNFLVNRGGATAADFLALAAVVKEKVLAKSGVLLEEEVRIVGE